MQLSCQVLVFFGEELLPLLFNGCFFFHFLFNFFSDVEFNCLFLAMFRCVIYAYMYIHISVHFKHFVFFFLSELDFLSSFYFGECLEREARWKGWGTRHVFALIYF